MSQFWALQSFKRLSKVILTLPNFRQQLCGCTLISTGSCTRLSPTAIRLGMGDLGSTQCGGAMEATS